MSEPLTDDRAAYNYPVSPEHHQELIGGKPLYVMSQTELAQEIQSIFNEGACVGYRHNVPPKSLRIGYIQGLIAGRNHEITPVDFTPDGINRLADSLRDYTAMMSELDNRPPFTTVQGRCGHLWVPEDPTNMGDCPTCKLISDRAVLVAAIKESLSTTTGQHVILAALKAIGEDWNG